MDLDFLTKSVFVFNLIISGNFLASLFGCQIQATFADNMLVKHSLGFLTLYFFVSLSDTSVPAKDPVDKLRYSLYIYLIFLASSRMDIQFWLMFIVTLGASYILQILQDSAKFDEATKAQFRKYSSILSKLSLVLVVLGCLVYLGEKKYEYGDTFVFQKFLLGKTACAHNALGDKRSIGWLQAINKAFA